MRGALILAMFGCGFEHGRVPMQPIDGDVVIDTIADAPIDVAPPDAAWTTAMCPSGYTTYGSQPSRYRLNPMGKNFWAHYDDCANDLAGRTHLAAVDTLAEAMAIITVINSTSNLPQMNGVVLPYAGGLQLRNQMAYNASWFSITGGTLFAGAWNASEPNDGGGGGSEDNTENHIGFFRNQTYMADIPGTWIMAGVCECDGLPIHTAFAAEVEATRL